MKHLTLKLLTALLLSATIVGCSDRPDGILDNKTMADVLYDVHLAESLTRFNYSAQTGSEKLYIKILDSHGLTPSEYDSCIAWYTHHPDEYLAVYALVQEKISAEKQHIMEYHPEVKEPKLLTLREPAPTHFSTGDSCSHPYIERFRCDTPRWIGWDK